MESTFTFDDVRPRVDELRQRLNRLRVGLSELFVEKEEVIDLMVIAALAQEPLLLVGRPGTAKSDLVIKFCQALGLEEGDYFEYMLTRFTEPSEVMGSTSSSSRPAATSAAPRASSPTPGWSSSMRSSSPTPPSSTRC